MRRKPLLIALFALMLPAQRAGAQSLFEFSLTDSGDPTNTLTVGGSTLPDLAGEFADVEGQFASFSGTAFTANLDYAGVADAATFTFDPTGGSAGGALLTIDNLLGFGAVPAFDEANGDLGDQLKDFFLEDNPDAISRFLQEIAKQSLVAVTDGNPLATTARSARYKFERFGLHADLTPLENQLFNRFSLPDQNEDGSNGVQLPHHQSRSLIRPRFQLTGQLVDSQGFSGTSVDLNSSFELAFNEHVSGVIGLPFSYHEVEGAHVFNGGIHLDLPIRIVIPEPGERTGWLWQITPGVNADFSGSFDFAAGGILYGLGVNNLVAYQIGDFTLLTSQQITTHEGQKLSIAGYEFDPGVSQRILKIGGKASWAANSKTDLFAGVTWTDFLEDAAVDTYWSPTLGVAFRFRNGSTISISYEADYADDFERQGARLEVQVPF